MGRYVEKELVSFEIEKIKAGWFIASFIHDKKRVTISASDIYANEDGPRTLLVKLIDLCFDDVSRRTVIWNAEAGYYFIILSRKDEACSISISYSVDAQCDMSCKDEENVDSFSKEKLCEMFPDWEDLLVVENIDLNDLFYSIYEQFGEQDIEDYQYQWMSYPSEELEKMKTIVNNRTGKENV